MSIFSSDQQASPLVFTPVDGGDAFEVDFNPENYDESYTNCYDTSTSPGNSGTSSKFKFGKPRSITLKFLIDGTGIKRASTGFGANLLGNAEPVDVRERLTAFATLFEYDGTTHRPKKIKAVWGDLEIEGVITKVDVNYKLFDPSGKPLRVQVSVTINESLTDEERAKKDNENSPDLTHQRQIIEGQRLPLMTEQIYDTPDYYLAVANANSLNHFRRLRPGQKINFPPVDKATA